MGSFTATLARTVRTRHTDTAMKFAVVCVVALAGCGEPEPAGVALDEAPAAYAAAYCERVFACCEASELDALLPSSGVGDRSECEAHVARVFGNEFVADVLRAEEMGRAKYDPVAMAACLDHLRTDPCAHLARPLRLMTFPRDCAPVRLPRVSIGDACDHDFHCVSGVCAGAVEHSDGRCEAVPATSGPCAAGDCGPDAYCDRSVTETGTCELIASVGSPCRSALGCESLSCTNEICAPPLCDGT